MKTLALAFYVVVACALCSCSKCDDPQIPIDKATHSITSVLPSGDVPARFERAVVVNGDAQLYMVARGVGDVVVFARLEHGDQEKLGRVALQDQHCRTILDLPGNGDRALLLRIEGPPTVQWDSLQIVEQREAIKSSSLVASCEGRNVVVFVADSLAARHTTIHGYERETTPGIEVLAADGVRFEAAHSQTSWTMPSVTSIFTAQTQERHGMLRMNQQLPEGVATLAQSFQTAGYKTVGLIQNGIIWKHTRLNRGFDEYDVRREGNKVSEEIMLKALELMNTSGAEPLFLYVHLTPPHQPYAPPKDFAADFVDPSYAGAVTGSVIDCAKINHYIPSRDGVDEEKLKQIYGEEVAESSGFYDADVETLQKMHDADAVRLQALYDGHIRYVDDMIANTMNEVWKTTSKEDWVVVVTSDHGEAFLQHGDQGHNTQVYEEMVHIPLVITAPGSALPVGREVSATVSLLDVGPTLRELAGLPAPDQIEDGRSLLPLIEDPERDPRRRFFFSSRYPKELDGKPSWTGMRFGDYKLLRSADGLELYDLTTDPLEANNLIDAQPVRAAAMATMLSDWRSGGARGEAVSGEIPMDALEQLRQLGYVDSEGNDVSSPEAGK